jgi:hypothetical protein
MPLSKYQGRIGPVDLGIMRRVFDTVCAERRIAQKDKEQRDNSRRRSSLRSTMARRMKRICCGQFPDVAVADGESATIWPIDRLIEPFAANMVAAAALRLTPVAFLAAGFLFPVTFGKVAEREANGW